ncbi:DUF2797 domain-containing protein [Pseudobacteriovorax antillogorgiicola]|uniref:DUF2797 domain-containing protein n=1 Tax=Pseudobacteriovorax antillogorgiicola TaxID=1513793 RepID=A0A1Y6B9E2_9BACT|nr:DUF2797 domain-containing protein [Pseudobacteriovorax antillogorgiicola]TCS58692.1 uncharacterized protein DUF2797 [Pseudobacteriovorax antillogorgiicola]SME95778.1 Protein of unknown function [Pseudobacteriovorax antillogorgiicola]
MKSELNLQKLKTEFRDGQEILYFMANESSFINLNEFLDQSLSLEFTGQINCIHCDRTTKKSFGQGFCFPCFRSLARCDMCLVRPETCHFQQGTCREPEWGIENCMQAHTVYLANSSGLKVGITRGENPLGRWMDQGAVAAIPLATVNRRIDAGRVEVALKQIVSDKTNWRKMLKGDVDEVDLCQEREKMRQYMPDDVTYQWSKAPAVNIRYPIVEHPKKVTSFNFDKNPLVEGTLKGIKGQYLIFDTGVINIRKFAGYRISFRQN